MKKLLIDLANDTLKRNGKFSPTLLTMFVFTVATLVYGFFDYTQRGFSSEVFWAFVSLASGIKVTDAISKKLTPKL